MGYENRRHHPLLGPTMRMLNFWFTWLWAGLFLVLLLPEPAPCSPTNCPPSVAIIWPKQDDLFSDARIKVKANVADRDGWITEVQFFVETNLIGVATTQPWNIIWDVGAGMRSAPSWSLKAV